MKSTNILGRSPRSDDFYLTVISNFLLTSIKKFFYVAGKR